MLPTITTLWLATNGRWLSCRLEDGKQLRKKECAELEAAYKAAARPAPPKCIVFRGVARSEPSIACASPHDEGGIGHAPVGEAVRITPEGYMGESEYMARFPDGRYFGRTHDELMRKSLAAQAPTA